MSKEERGPTYPADNNYNDGTYNPANYPPAYPGAPPHVEQPAYGSQPSNFDQSGYPNQSAGPNQAGPNQAAYPPQYGSPGQSNYVNQAAGINQPTQPNQTPYQNQPYFSGPPAQPEKIHSTFGARLNAWAVRTGAPINKFTNRIGSEAFWPSSMEKECDKAARILKSFCHDGFYADKHSHQQNYQAQGKASQDGPKSDAKALVKIPQKVIQNCVGLAIFTTLRTGLHISGAGGSGVLIARLPDGSWSPPSGILVHTLGAGLVIGIDIYDCVCVINTPTALQAFTHPRVSLGGEVSVAAGPVGTGANVEGAIGKSAKPVWSYLKSRGLYAGVQVDGTIILERTNENEKFYGKRLTVDQILRGDVGSGGAGPAEWPMGAHMLMEVAKSADGKRDVNEAVMRDIGEGPTPGDLAEEKEGIH